MCRENHRLKSENWRTELFTVDVINLKNNFFYIFLGNCYLVIFLKMKPINWNMQVIVTKIIIVHLI